MDTDDNTIHQPAPGQQTLQASNSGTSGGQRMLAVGAAVLLSALFLPSAGAATNSNTTHYLPPAEVNRAMRRNYVPPEPKPPESSSLEQAKKLHAEGQALWAEKKAAKAMEAFAKAARLGSAESCTKLGDIYWNGEGGVRVDRTEAMKFYERAGRLGDAANYTRLGFIHYSGEGGVPMDDAKALAYFKKAAAMGDRCGPGYRCSLQMLGLMAESGRGQSANPQRAAEYYRREIEREWKSDDGHRSGNPVWFLIELPIPLTKSDLKLIKGILKQASPDDIPGPSALLKLADKMERLAEGTKDAGEAESLRAEADGLRAENIAGLEEYLEYLKSPSRSGSLQLADKMERRAEGTKDAGEAESLRAEADKLLRAREIAWRTEVAAEVAYRLARLYERGFGTSERRAQAKSLLQEAAAAGYEPARTHLERKAESEAAGG